jgi:hypothetical protein
MFSLFPSFLGVGFGSSFASLSKKTKTKNKKKSKKKTKKKKSKSSTIDGKDIETTTTTTIRKRRVLPGEVTLDRESWVHEMKDTIVEYNDVLVGQRQLGLVQRPTGKRFWAIIDEKGIEREVNIYQISFQWPIQQPQLPQQQQQQIQSETKNELQGQGQLKNQLQSWGVSPTELYKYREYALELLRQQQVDVRTVWRHFLKKNEERLNGYIVAKFIFRTSMFHYFFMEFHICLDISIFFGFSSLIDYISLAYIYIHTHTHISYFLSIISFFDFLILRVTNRLLIFLTNTHTHSLFFLFSHRETFRHSSLCSPFIPLSK